MKILALDCATRLGWASKHELAGREGLDWGHEDFPIPRGSSAGMRWINFLAWLERMIDQVKPELIVFEQPFIGAMRSGTAAEIAYGMSTRVQQVAEARGIDYRPVSAAVLKKWATGKGNAGKPEMIAAANQKLQLGFADEPTISDDNEADAALILLWAMAGMPEPEPARKKPARKKKAVAA